MIGNTAGMKYASLKTSLVTLSIFLLNGCALTVAQTREQVELREGGQKSTSFSRHISISCGVKTYSFMPSVVIPLPPILPSPWARDTATLVITAYKHDIPQVYLLTYENGQIKEQQIPSLPERPNYLDKTAKDWVFPFAQSCPKLNGAKLKVEYRKAQLEPPWATEKHDLFYSNSGVSFKTMYLSND